MPWFEKLKNDGTPTGEQPRFFTQQQAENLLRIKGAKWRHCEEEKPKISRKKPVEATPENLAIEAVNSKSDTEFVTETLKLTLAKYREVIQDATPEQLEGLRALETRKSAIQAIDKRLNKKP